MTHKSGKLPPEAHGSGKVKINPTPIETPAFSFTDNSGEYIGVAVDYDLMKGDQEFTLSIYFKVSPGLMFSLPRELVEEFIQTYYPEADIKNDNDLIPYIRRLAANTLITQFMKDIDPNYKEYLRTREEKTE